MGQAAAQAKNAASGTTPECQFRISSIWRFSSSLSDPVSSTKGFG
jgi:hypothetical protein